MGGALSLSPENIDREIKLTQCKIEAGVDFFLTQPVFDPEKVEAFLSAFEAVNGKLNVPILAGVLPLASDRHAGFLHNEVPGITIPDEIQNCMTRAGDQGAREGV